MRKGVKKKGAGTVTEPPLAPVVLAQQNCDPKLE